jgi:hypothetical protein
MSPRTKSLLARCWELTKAVGGPAAVVAAIVFLARVDFATRANTDALHEVTASLSVVVRDQRATERAVATNTANIAADRRDLDRHEQQLARLIPVRLEVTP